MAVETKQEIMARYTVVSSIACSLSALVLNSAQLGKQTQSICTNKGWHVGGFAAWGVVWDRLPSVLFMRSEHLGSSALYWFKADANVQTDVQASSRMCSHSSTVAYATSPALLQGGKRYLQRNGIPFSSQLGSKLRMVFCTVAKMVLTSETAVEQLKGVFRSSLIAITSFSTG